jgi:DNA repair exonuclease SbcCD nuclease subunit
MIFITGDTHIPHDISKLATDSFPVKTLTKNDVVIICGDFGLLWEDEPDKTEIYWTNWLIEKPFTTLFISGNHDNYNRLAKLDVIEKFGGPVGIVNDSIFHLKTGYIYIIENKKFFCFGGAMTTDKNRRIENESWWKQEIPSDEEFELALHTISAHSSVDYVVAHTLPRNKIAKLLTIFGIDQFGDYNTAPHGMLSTPRSGYVDEVSTSLIQRLSDPTAKMLEEICDKMLFDHYYCGHFHEDMDIDDKFRILFNKVEKLHDIK